MKICHLRNFRYSPLGLRDGILAQMLADHDKATETRKQIEAERRDAILSMCRRYQVDIEAAENVRQLSIHLFRELRRVHNLPEEYEGWLSAAALLHDIGSFVNRSGRHRHAYYLISNGEIFGFTPEQRQIIAAIARYIGKSRPNIDDIPMKALNRDHRELVPRAVLLLRLARAMSHGLSKNITKVTAEVDRQNVLLKLKAMRSANLELWVLQKERANSEKYLVGSWRLRSAELKSFHVRPTASRRASHALSKCLGEMRLGR